MSSFRSKLNFYHVNTIIILHDNLHLICEANILGILRISQEVIGAMYEVNVSRCYITDV